MLSDKEIIEHLYTEAGYTFNIADYDGSIDVLNYLDNLSQIENKTIEIIEFDERKGIIQARFN